MTVLYNLAKVSTATTGTGTITLGSATTGYLTFAQAGVQNGDVVAYGIRDGANSEVGTGTYTSSGTTLTRSVTKSTNSNNPINLSGSAEVYITARSEDIVNKTGDTMTGSLTLLNTGLKVQDTDASHTLSIIPGTNLTANRTLTFTTGDASRNITFQGDTTIPAVFPTSTTDNTLPRFDGTSGSFQTSGVAVDDSNNVTGVLSLDIGNADTTISRASAGVIAVEGSNVLMASNIGSTVQGYNANLNSIATAYSAPTATNPAQLNLLEATNNGSNYLTLLAPNSISSNKNVAFQDVAGTVYISNGTDVAVVDGGTGSSSASGARTNLGCGDGTVTGAGALVLSSAPTLTIPVINGFSGDTSAITIGTNQLVKDVSGNIGIGTASPSAKFDLASGNLKLSGSNQRIQADFSAIPVSNRSAIQTSVTNGNTYIPVITNGTGTVSSIDIYNSSDQTNGSRLTLGITSTLGLVSTSYNGTGSFLPLSLQTSGLDRLFIATDGKIGIGTTTPSSTLTVLGSSSIFSGSPSSQQISLYLGWNNGIKRWAHVIEADASYALYSYDASGASPAARLNINNSTGQILIGNAFNSGSLYVVGAVYGGGASSPWSITSNGSDIFMNTGAASQGITFRPNGAGSGNGEFSVGGNGIGVYSFKNSSGSEFARFSNGSLGIGTSSPSTYGTLAVAGANSSIYVGAGSYGRYALSGGNTDGYLFGSFASLGDGVHLSFNYYANAAGTDIIPNSGLGTSRISCQYGFINFATGATNTVPVNCAQFDSSGNIKFNSGYGSVATAYGCRAWVNFNGTGTVAIRSSGNVSSITDNGVGIYSVNFTNSMPDTNYNVVTATNHNSGTQRVVACTTETYNTGSIAINTSYASGSTSGVLWDPSLVNVSIFR